MLRVSEARWAATIRHFTKEYTLSRGNVSLYFVGNKSPTMTLASQRLVDLGGKIVTTTYLPGIDKTVLTIKEPTLI